MEHKQHNDNSVKNRPGEVHSFVVCVPASPVGFWSLMKRFTETTKWLDPWFADLGQTEKLLWLYLCDNCDSSGVIDLSYRIVGFLVGCHADAIPNHLKALGDRVKILPSGKILIPRFVQFQYGALSDKSNLHKSVLMLIEKNQVSKFMPSGCYQDAILMGPSKGKGKGIGKVNKYSDDFLTFWSAYPRKVGKGKAWESWQKMKPPLSDTLKVVEKYKHTPGWTKDSGQFIPNPATFLNQKRWEDEPGSMRKELLSERFERLQREKNERN